MKGGDGSAAKKGIAAKTAGKVATDERTFDVVQFMRSRALQLDAGGILLSILSPLHTWAKGK